MSEDTSDKYPSQLLVNVLRVGAYVISKAFWFIRYRGFDNIPDISRGGFVIAANHQTYIDPAWICLPITKRRFRFMAYDEAFKWRFIGPLIKYLGAFPVSGHVGDALDAMRQALHSLREGAVLLVFPEGEREFADGKMLAFKPGAIRVALEAGVPILPVTVRGGNRVWPQKQTLPRLFRRVEIIYHPPILIEEYPDRDPHEEIKKYIDLLETIIAGAYGYPETPVTRESPDLSSRPG